MKLYLVQHGEACSKEENPDRPLTQQGKTQVQRFAEFLNKAGIEVSRVIHSGKLRAAETAELLSAAVAPGIEPEINGLMNPNDNPKAFDWQSESWDKDMLVVGHLPFMARLVSHLVVEDENQAVSAFRPGTIVCLERGDDDHWQINWMIRPELLK